MGYPPKWEVKKRGAMGGMQGKKPWPGQNQDMKQIWKGCVNGVSLWGALISYTL